MSIIIIIYYYIIIFAVKPIDISILILFKHETHDYACLKIGRTGSSTQHWVLSLVSPIF